MLVNVIYTCLSTCSMSILWNGTPTESFQPTRGIRQGDPLSPYLFVLCMERLIHVIESAVAQRRWKPVSVCRGSPPISNLMFADDVVLFAEASIEQAQIIKECLETFCAASGQRINHAKSKILFSTNPSQSEAETISDIIEIPITEDLGKYLGVPTLSKKVTKATFQHVIDRVDKRLTG